DGREMVLATLQAGEFFGELALLDGQDQQTDAVAKEACRLWLLRREQFAEFLHRRPDAATQLLGLLAQRLRRSTQLAYDVAFLDVPARLARALLELAGDTDTAPRTTQAELAAMVGATRESINKWLGTFQRLG